MKSPVQVRQTVCRGLRRVLFKSTKDPNTQNEKLIPQKEEPKLIPLSIGIGGKWLSWSTQTDTHHTRTQQQFPKSQGPQLLKK